MRAFPVMAGVAPVPFAAFAENNVHPECSFNTDYYTIS
jgi:hypothetical protein